MGRSIMKHRKLMKIINKRELIENARKIYPKLIAEALVSVQPMKDSLYEDILKIFTIREEFIREEEFTI